MCIVQVNFYSDEQLKLAPLISIYVNTNPSKKALLHVRNAETDFRLNLFYAQNL